MSDVRVIERDHRDRLGEGLLWSAREAALYWVDILGARVNHLDLASGRIVDWAMPDTIGWLIERAPALIVPGSVSCPCASWPQRWLPGTNSMQPASIEASDNATQAVTCS